VSKWPKNEIELAAEVVGWLESNEWDVYQEVQFQAYGNVADIVAIDGNIVYVLEAKTSFSFKLLEQSYRWTNYAHYVSCAVPSFKRSDMQFKRKICKKFGIGLIEVANPEWTYKENINVLEIPRLNIGIDGKYIKESLTPEHKTFAKAGNADGKYFTPFQATCLNVVNLVKANPGIDLKTLIYNLDHHYSSDATARACISKFTQEGIIKGVETRREGKFLKFYPIGRSP
jgi:hypothetical protein